MHNKSLQVFQRKTPLHLILLQQTKLLQQEELDPEACK